MKIENIIRTIDKFNILYEDMAWKDERIKLDIYYEDDKIIMKLYNEKEILDILELSFDSRERKKYLYYVIRHFISVLGNVRVYKRDNVFYNEMHKSYLRVIVNDLEIMRIINEYMNRQEELQIDEIFDRELYSKIPLRERHEDKRVDDVLKKRYEITKKLLRS